ncbi:MAG: TIGR03032 family protein [Symploca sp. SIO2B6]|nr:TIGR03032 family protein [Symploca sp. SIO2B6]
MPTSDSADPASLDLAPLDLASLDLAPLQYVHSPSFAELLTQLGISLFVSTYQAGRLMVVQAQGEKLSTLLRNFVQVMGLALTPHRLAIGTRNQVHFFRNVSTATNAFAAENRSDNPPDACYAPRHSIVTGDIRVHELAWVEDQLWVVNTQFSCLCTLHPDYSFVPQWRPPFITQIAMGDRCHLNGFAVVEGQPKYATVFARTDVSQGWRSHKVDGGCILDIPTGEVVAHGLSMPHSPRVYAGQLWVLNSGRGQLVTVDLNTGALTTVAEFPGFTRGLAFYGRYALIGLSQIREKETFGGLPLEDRFDDLKCGVWAIDIVTGETVAFLEFQDGCSELFDLQVLSTAQHPMVLGFQKEDINRLFFW